MTAKKMKIDAMTKEFAIKLEQSKTLVISCQKCDRGWMYYHEINSFNAILAEVKRHLLKDHGVKL